MQLVRGQFTVSELVANSFPALTVSVADALVYVKAAVVGNAGVRVAQLMDAVYVTE